MPDAAFHESIIEGVLVGGWTKVAYKYSAESRTGSATGAG
jgi:hypothetical protein